MKNNLIEIAKDTDRVILINNGIPCGIVNKGFASGDERWYLTETSFLELLFYYLV